MKKILIVDDSEITHLLLNMQLDSFDITIDNAYDGKEAILFVEENDYDIILMDLTMPIMCGNESTAHIKKIKQHIPVYSISAYNVDEIDNEQYDGHLQKPIDFNKITKVFLKNGIQKK